MTERGERELESLVENVMQDGNARGIALGVVEKDGTLVYERYFGYRDAENKLPINRDTIFGLASITKSFTALSIMQMQKDGILSVDDPVSKYIPEFKDPQPEKVKLWHLMCHSGGFFPLPRIVVDKTAAEMGIEDSLENGLDVRSDFADEGVLRVATRLSSQTRFTGRPGERMSYCNDGFGLLSDIIRRYSGYGSYAEYVKERILNPLGMTRSNIAFLRNSLDDNAAVLYSLENGEWRADRDYQNDAFVLPGGGAMKSTLSDMLRYAIMYLNEGEGIIDRYSIHEMEKPLQIVKPGLFYGYGLESKALSDMTIIEHGGSLPGVSSNFSYSHEAGCGVIVLCNTMDVAVSAIADGLMRFYLDFPIVPERPTHREKKWSTEEIEGLEGSYISGEGDSFILKKSGDGLSMTFNGNPLDLIPLYSWQGMVRKKYSDVYLTAIRDENGKVFAARYGTRIFPKE